MIDRLINMSQELARECGDGNFEAYLPRPAYEKVYCEIAERTANYPGDYRDQLIRAGYLVIRNGNGARIIVREIVSDAPRDMGHMRRSQS